jgi:hypothetical protein
MEPDQRRQRELVGLHQQAADIARCVPDTPDQKSGDALGTFFGFHAQMPDKRPSFGFIPAHLSVR